ncbi:hypothetical protein B0H12DRAFT_1070456 [Mycena haematopus]|nr:hypothetical protein B0H12DRAFT_1070456 [Mycena haematopus]
MGYGKSGFESGIKNGGMSGGKADFVITSYLLWVTCPSPFSLMPVHSSLMPARNHTPHGRSHRRGPGGAAQIFAPRRASRVGLALSGGVTSAAQRGGKSLDVHTMRQVVGVMSRYPNPHPDAMLLAKAVYRDVEDEKMRIVTHDAQCEARGFDVLTVTSGKSQMAMGCHIDLHRHHRRHRCHSNVAMASISVYMKEVQQREGRDMIKTRVLVQQLKNSEQGHTGVAK